MIINPYYLRARLSPTILTSIPVLSVYWYFISPLVSVQLAEVPYLPIVGDITLSAAIVFLLIQVNRFISKEIFQRIYFKDEVEMPTTNYLLWKDGFFTTSIKESIRKKIKESFDIDLFDQDQERLAELDARKQICFAVSQIRVHLKDNKMLLRHNIEYGFFRNLLGGCAIAVLFCLLGMLLSYPYQWQNDQFTYFSILLSLYTIPVIFSKLLIKRYGAYYGKILYEQFLSLKIQP